MTFDLLNVIFQLEIINYGSSFQKIILQCLKKGGSYGAKIIFCPSFDGTGCFSYLESFFSVVFSHPFSIWEKESGNSTKDIVEKFRLALAASLDESVELGEFKLKEKENGEFEELVWPIVRVQKIEVAKKEYLTIYLLKADQKRLIWGIPLDRLKKPGSIRKYVKEATEAIIYEVFYAR